MLSKLSAPCLLVLLVAISTCPTVQGFNLGVKGIKCNLVEGIEDINDPCGLYDAVCVGKNCKCPPGKHEDPNLKRCIPGEAPKVVSGGTQAGRGGGDDLFDDDLLANYDPNKKPSAPVAPPPHQPPPGPPQPGYPGNPNQPQPGYPGNPNQPQPGYPGNPNQPQPGYPGNPNQPQPGYPGSPNQPQPGYPTDRNRPGYDKNRPGQKGNKGDDNVGEEVGGGVGGILGLLLLGCLIYFCCCKGGKGKRNEMMNKFGGGRFQGIPFMGQGQQAGVPGQAVQMQQSPPVQQDPNFASQHTYIPPGGGVDPAQQYPPQQPYPPPQGFVPDGQQPPPYTQQYQPNVPPPQ